MLFSFKSYVGKLDITRLEDIVLVDVNNLILHKAQDISYGPGHCSYRACYAPCDKFSSLEEAFVYVLAMNFAKNYRLDLHAQFYEREYAAEKLTEAECHQWVNGLIEGFYQFTCPIKDFFEFFKTEVNLPGFKKGYRIKTQSTEEILAIELETFFMIFSFSH